MRSYGTFQDPYLLKRHFRRRLLGIVIFMVVLILLLLIRLFYLQVAQHKYYTTLSRNNSISLVPIAPTRGLIYDRNGVLLAKNMPVYNLNIVPDETPDIANTIKELQQFIQISPEDVDLFYKELKQKHAYEQVPLKIKLTPTEVAQFAVNRYRFPGVDIKTAMVRYYPFANDLVSVLGYVGRINENDLKNLDTSNYAATNYIGKIGIEKYFETQLHGTVGYQQVETDASGEEVRVLKRTPSVHGQNLYLTIDSQLQEASLQAMKGFRGSVVAIQPATGQVLAMVSTPAYNPNMFVDGISAADYHALQVSKEQPLFNRAIRGQFPFGSTIKIFFALAGLAGGYVDPNATMYDPGYFKIGGHVFHGEAKNVTVNLVKAIEVSSDTYFYKLALKMGIDNMDNILEEFGFGQYTHIQMGEELPGLVASPDWKMKTEGKRWYAGDTLNSGIGQGAMLTTPLQLASAAATFAERGQGFQPTLLYKVVNPDGSTYTPTPIAKPPIDIKPNVWETVIKGMVDVVRGPEGTAWRFGKPSYSVAAKTGTAQVFSLRGAKYILANVPKHLRDNSMFVAFAPVKNPQIAIAVAIQNSPSAPVVARKVLDFYLLQQGHLYNDATPTSNNSTTVGNNDANQQIPQ
jgi:penicillin-binding protein 2